MPGPNGTRDLTLEENLSRLEQAFSEIRRAKLRRRLPLTAEEHLRLCMFTMAMHGRTRDYKTHWSQQWGQALELLDRVQTAVEQATPEQRTRMRQALQSPNPSGERLTREDVVEHMNRPIQAGLPVLATDGASMLFQIPFVILAVRDPVRFITSDTPCVWFDPASYEKPPPFGAGGLVSPTLEITLPLSPTQMLFFGRKLVVSNTYLTVSDKTAVQSLNRRTATGSCVIADSKHIYPMCCS